MRFRAILLAFILLPAVSFAQEFNAGFVQGLWYSDANVFVDKPVRIYVAIRNNTGADLTGRVEFFDNDASIGRSNVSAINGHIVESWADWTPSFGSHKIRATLSRIELHRVGSSTKAVEVTSALAEDVIFVDYDTDGDGIGNEADKDDDGDGLSDEVEKKNGTDPLTYNEPETAPEEIVSEEPAEREHELDGGGSDTPAAENPDFPQGLEQYLTNSPARTALTGISNLVETSKRNIDAYRERREEAAARAADPINIEVNDDGFGEIIRSSSTKREIRTPEIEKGGIVDTIFSMIKTLFNVVYTALLAAASLYLGHPLYFQLTLLILILFGMYKLARKFGDRPR